LDKLKKKKFFLYRFDEVLNKKNVSKKIKKNQNQNQNSKRMKGLRLLVPRGGLVCGFGFRRLFSAGSNVTAASLLEAGEKELRSENFAKAAKLFQQTVTEASGDREMLFLAHNRLVMCYYFFFFPFFFYSFFQGICLCFTR
jgi:hypothetical protein